MLMCSTFCLSLENSSVESEQGWLHGDLTSLLMGGKTCHSMAPEKKKNHENLSKKLRNLTQTKFEREIRDVTASFSSSFCTEAPGILPFKKSHVKVNSNELPFPKSLTLIYLKDCSHRAIYSCSTQSPRGLGTECFYILPEPHKFQCFVPQKNPRTTDIKIFHTEN